MRNYIILFFSVLSFLYGCNGGVPSGVLPPDKMTAVLHDVYLADGRISIMQQVPDTIYKYGWGRYLAIFKKFGTDSAQFRKSYLYYCTDPDQLIAINAKILAELNPKSDSLRKVLSKQQADAHKLAPVPVVASHTISTFHPSGATYGPGVAPPPPSMQKAVPTTHASPPAQHLKTKKDTSHIRRE